MTLSMFDQTMRILHDFQNAWAGSPSQIQGFLDRGTRDMARRAFVIQKRYLFQFQPNVVYYPLPADHVDAFTMFRDTVPALPGGGAIAARLLSQDGHVWWLESTRIGTMTDAQPAGTVLFATPDISWLQIASADGSLWYVFPSITGNILVRDTPPPVGTGSTQTVILTDADHIPWLAAVTNAGNFQWRDQTRLTMTDDRAMQEVEPEAITRIDQRLATGPPERFAIMGNSILLIHPTPDKVYNARLLYFSDDLAALPAACSTQPPLMAAALALERWQRLYESHRYLALYRHHPSQELLAMYQDEIKMLAANLSPFSRDGKDLYEEMPQS